MLADAQLDLADHRQLGLAHEIERASHRPLGRVLDWHHRVVGLPRFGCSEDLVDRRVRLGVHEVAEMARLPPRG